MSETLSEVRLLTEQSTILRPNYESGGMFRSALPFDRITYIEHAGGRVAVSSPDIPEEPPGYRTEYTLRIGSKIFNRLLDYVATKMNAGSPPPGNCHEFSWHMIGRPRRNYEEATSEMNKTLQGATNCDGSNLFLGSVVLIGYNGFSRMVHPTGQKPSSDWAELGPLQISHSCVAVDIAADPGQTLALHRMALNGPLGITTIGHALREYRSSVPTMGSAYWIDGRVPGISDIKLYCPQL